MEPLTGRFQRSPGCFELVKVIIEDVIKLWSYLSFTEATLEQIDPKVGERFDKELHSMTEGFGVEDQENVPERRIGWVLFPGFLLREENIHGVRSMVVKALVAT